MTFLVYGKYLNSLPNSGAHLVTGDLRMEAQSCLTGAFALSAETRRTSKKLTSAACNLSPETPK